MAKAGGDGEQQNAEASAPEEEGRAAQDDIECEVEDAAPSSRPSESKPAEAEAEDSERGIRSSDGDGALIPPSSFQAIRTPGDLLPAVSGDGFESVEDHGPADGHVQVTHKPGEVIDGRYVLTRPIDAGGMGVVWLAHSLQLKVDVAVKLPNTRRSVSSVERMTREARATAKLTHPAVVRIHDFGKTEKGDPYIAMELLRGQSLGRRLDNDTALDPIDAVRLLLPIVEALVTAHDCGIVHRDLKPDNIFLAEAFGRTYPKLLDFSLVKLIAPDFGFSTLTRDGRGLGTAPYLSPEQVKGMSDVDHRTDVWAMCAVLYRSSTGHPPFAGTGQYDVMRAVVRRNPTPTWKLGVGDHEYWDILKRGLMKKPEQRYASMRELGRDLAAWLLNHGVTEDVGHVSLRAMWLPETQDGLPRRRAATARRTLRVAAIAALGAALGMALATWIARRSGDAPSDPERAVAAPAGLESPPAESAPALPATATATPTPDRSAATPPAAPTDSPSLRRDNAPNEASQGASTAAPQPRD